jgi:hypothetical protein
VKASQLLTSIATTQLSAGYTLTGTIHISITQATINSHTQLVVFSFTGTWVYALTPQELQQIKHLIAGRTKHDALQLLLLQQGVASVTIAGVPDNQPLPEDITHIHLLLLFGVA